uniref:Putative secreted protein n=1 Tax=Anopheles darlingi TaxID=43151 RepID=A0A2M4D0G1_ANODA
MFVAYRPLLCVLCSIALGVILISHTEGCELDQTQHGCRIDNGQCTCAFGCKSEFRYATRKECQDALKVCYQDDVRYNKYA